MLSKLLIANRGEIAVRIARTAKRMGVETVAVYAEPDASAPHVRACDTAIALGGAAAAESYLDIAKILAAAERSSADAIHPGYGFLSENADFAEAVEAAGLVFVGPTPDTIRAMGSKSAAKDLMANAGVPTAPGYQGADQTQAVFEAESVRIGYPVLLKATAGGGGKGMRLVERAEDLPDALAAAQREAASAFGNDRLLVEKYIPRARHLEVQVFGDGAGDVVHLFERDCSVQRRHQKIIEEAPAPNLPAPMRAKLLQAGVDAAKAVAYRGAGTVEFLYDGADSVFFMEMNTRLQVEHPVSEAITGVDCVEWQLRIAAGEPLPLSQDAITEHGHAFEARIYAETPDRDFAPSVGMLQTLKLPSDRTRVDSGVAEGQAITPHYDPMIAKLITHAPTRAGALGKLRSALAHTHIAGVETNTRVLAALACDAAFARGEVSTRYLDEHAETVFSPAPPDARVWAAAALVARQQAERFTGDGAGGSPALHGFRLNAPHEALFWARLSEDTVLLRLRPQGADAFQLSIERDATAAHRRAAGQDYAPAPPELLDFRGVDEGGGAFRLTLDGVDTTVFTAPHGPDTGVRIWIGAEHWDMDVPDVLSGAEADTAAPDGLTAQLPGVVTLIPVAAGDVVSKGAPLIVLEAMKMEHTVTAPHAGVVERIHFAPGDAVQRGDALLELRDDGTAST